MIENKVANQLMKLINGNDISLKDKLCPICGKCLPNYYRSFAEHILKLHPERFIKDMIASSCEFKEISHTEFAITPFDCISKFATDNGLTFKSPILQFTEFMEKPNTGYVEDI